MCNVDEKDIAEHLRVSHYIHLSLYLVWCTYFAGTESVQL